MIAISLSYDYHTIVIRLSYDCDQVIVITSIFTNCGLEFGHQQALDGIIKDGLWDVYNNVNESNTLIYTRCLLLIPSSTKRATLIVGSHG